MLHNEHEYLKTSLPDPYTNTNLVMLFYDYTKSRKIFDSNLWYMKAKILAFKVPQTRSR